MKTFNIYIDSRQKWVRVAPQLDQNDVIWSYNASICKDLETGTFYLVSWPTIPESDILDGKLMPINDAIFDRNLLRAIFQDYERVTGALEINENVVEMLCAALNMTREEYAEGMFDNIPLLNSLTNLDPLNVQFIIVSCGEEDNSTDKNKVLRTITTGQSDITRHEAYTKVTGLNEYNGLVPTYINKEQTLNQMLQIVKKYIPDAQSIILYHPAVTDLYSLTSAFIGVAIKHNFAPEAEVIPGTEYEYCLIEADGTQKAHILMNCSIDPDMPAGHTHTRYDVILAQCTGRLYIQSETIQANIKNIPMDDFIRLWDLSINLIDTNMELYFKLAFS